MNRAQEIAIIESWRGLSGRQGLGELTMPQMHVVLGTSSFAAGLLVMHLLHRYKVMK